MIALVTMLIDHGAATLLETYIYNQTGDVDGLITLYMILRGIGRMAFPIYIFLLVEGFSYTRSRVKYAARLLLFALLSEVPFDMAFQHEVLEFGYNNVFFTLFLGLVSIMIVDWVKKKEFSLVVDILLSVVIVGVFYCIAEYLLCTDYGGGGVLAIFTMYMLRSKKELAMILTVFVLSIFASSIELLALFMVIPIHFYNGERGKQMKYLFYLFYPVHLLILGLLLRLF